MHVWKFIKLWGLFFYCLFLFSLLLMFLCRIVHSILVQMINSRLVHFLNVPLGEGAYTVTYLIPVRFLLNFLWFLSRSMFPGFVAKSIDAECGDKCSLAAACKRAAKAEEMMIWNLRVMTRQARSNDLKSKGHERCKVGLVTMPRVSQECRLPGKSLVRRQVRGQTCRIESVGDGRGPDRWDACPDKGCHCSRAQMKTAQKSCKWPSEEVSMWTKAASCLSLKRAKALQGFSNRFLLAKKQDRTGS